MKAMIKIKSREFHSYDGNSTIYKYHNYINNKPIYIQTNHNTKFSAHLFEMYRVSQDELLCVEITPKPHLVKNMTVYYRARIAKDLEPFKTANPELFI